MKACLLDSHLVLCHHLLCWILRFIDRQKLTKAASRGDPLTGLNVSGPKTRGWPYHIDTIGHGARQTALKRIDWARTVVLYDVVL